MSFPEDDRTANAEKGHRESIPTKVYTLRESCINEKQSAKNELPTCQPPGGQIMCYTLYSVLCSRQQTIEIEFSKFRLVVVVILLANDYRMNATHEDHVAVETRTRVKVDYALNNN